MNGTLLDYFSHPADDIEAILNNLICFSPKDIPLISFDQTEENGQKILKYSQDSNEEGSQLYIKKIKLADREATPLLVSQQARSIIGNEEDFAGFLDYDFWYSQSKQFLNNRFSLLHLNPMESPLDTVGIRHHISSKFGILTYGTIVFWNNEIFSKLGVKVPEDDQSLIVRVVDGHFLLTNNSDTVISEIYGQSLEKAGIHISYKNTDSDVYLSVSAGLKTYSLRLGKKPRPSYPYYMFGFPQRWITDVNYSLGESLYPAYN